MHASDIGWERGTGGRVVRVIRDGETGRKWRVWLADTSRVPGARAARCLIFDTGDLIRRVWRVPDDWARMTAAGLLTLVERSPGQDVGAPREVRRELPATA
ncbi:hypothetical protein [Roseisolibacter sp. H3M3-2]|uniref:hypothetical protein n=1 Tax=Roseisolibacter sp. H3M3-2 TaxID=3031323 RepID=UPI0023DBD8CC|nr:hypothetical protein [Roseisolibacter sp. H3M3-2]MDF1505062.1 hypothetical protein [Roseisolibacter sp. H3M3-2]